MPADQRDLIFALLRRGMPRRGIAEAAGVSQRTVYRMLATLDGVIVASDVCYDQRYLAREERYELARLHDLGWSIRKIAGRLGRSASTISRSCVATRTLGWGSICPRTPIRWRGGGSGAPSRPS
jgi:transposase